MRQPGNRPLACGSGKTAGGGRLAAALMASCVFATTLSLTLNEASALTKVGGKSDAVTLTAEDAPIGEVLAALSSKFGLIYTPTPGLNHTVGGSYSGPLQDVLTRVLDGCDYVVSYSSDQIELKVLGQSDSPARPSTLPPQPAPSAAASAPQAGQVLANAHPRGR